MNSTISKIMYSAWQQFEKFGYSKTTMRQISEGANVSPGLINHHFISKENIAAQVLEIISNYLKEEVAAYVSLDEDPLLFDAVFTRGKILFFLQGSFRQFYIDCLKSDIIFNYMTNNPLQILPRLEKVYGMSVDQDSAILYNQYMPYNLEKTLVLKKEEGLFQGIPYEEIPAHVCIAALEKFIPREDILQADLQGRDITGKILDKIPPLQPQTLIDQFLHM